MFVQESDLTAELSLTERVKHQLSFSLRMRFWETLDGCIKMTINIERYHQSDCEIVRLKRDLKNIY